MSPLGIVGGCHIRKMVEKLVALANVMEGASSGTGGERERERVKVFNNALYLEYGSLVVYGKTVTLLSYRVEHKHKL